MKFVDKQLAIKLKEKGFDKPCFGWYDTQIIGNNELYLNVKEGSYKDLLEYTNDFEWIIDAPTIDQVLEWLREEKKIHLVIDIKKRQKVCENIIWGYFVVLLDNSFHCVRHYDFESDSYEDACIAGINFVVEHLI